MLETYVEKAELADGMKILDLGCGSSCLGFAAMADSFNKVAVGGLEHSTLLRYFQTPRSRRSQTQELRKLISIKKLSQKDFRTFES